MSEYSELIGSFLRSGSFPLEAEYVFTSKLELDSWAEDNLVYIHEGLIKVVKDDGLYYATKNTTLNKFEFVGLSSKQIEKIELVTAAALNDLLQKILDNEKVIAEALNDLNKRLITHINECLSN